MNKIIRKFLEAGTIRGLQIFQILRLGGILLTGILFTKSPFTIQEIGIYESLMFVSTLFSFFWINGLLHSLLNSYRRVKPEGDVSRIQHTGILIILLNTILVGLLWLFQPLIQHFLLPEAEAYYSLLLIYILLNNPTFLIEYHLLLKERPRGMLMYGILSFLIHLLLVAGPALSGMPFIWSIYGLIIIAFLKNLVLIQQVYSNRKQKISFSHSKEIIITALPLILSFLISGSADYIDGFLITTHFGSDIFALYRYGARELPLAVLLASSLSSAIVPVLSAQGRYEEGLATIRKESSHLMHLLFPTTIVLMLCSTYIYPIVFREEFILSADIFNIYLLLLISRVLFPQTLILAHGRNDLIFKVAIAEITINIVSSYLLMLEFGMYGVAWGTVIAFSSEKIILFWLLRRTYGIKFNQLLHVRTWAIYSILLIITYLLKTINNFY